MKSKLLTQRKGETMRAKELTQEQIDKIIELNKKGWSTKHIYETLGITKYQAYGTIRRYKLKSNCNKILTPLDIEEIQKLYLEGMTIKQIHHSFFKDKCSEGAINQVLRKLGITRQNGIQATINHDYFENIDTEHKAYWIGLLLADGSISKKVYENGSYTYNLRLELKASDRDLIEALVCDLESNKIVREYTSGDNRGRLKKKHNAYVLFSSRKLGEDLEKYGIVPNKTYILKDLPQIPHELMRHFIRGYFDGDGSVFIDSKTNALRTAFYGTHDFVANIQAFLQAELGFRDKKVHDQKEASVSFINYAKQESEMLYNYMYNGATVYLERKLRVFQKCL